MIPDQSKADFSLVLHRNHSFTILDRSHIVPNPPEELRSLTTQNRTASNSIMIPQTRPLWIGLPFRKVGGGPTDTTAEIALRKRP